MHKSLASIPSTARKYNCSGTFEIKKATRMQTSKQNFNKSEKEIKKTYDSIKYKLLRDKTNKACIRPLH
jgi:hypothetical protein